ncbi:MAG: hypothetical protein E7539_06770 [Ruminococcaceae bacterium]|nr:hypothetical protein [Oscillospiraceae bacterium]
MKRNRKKLFTLLLSFLILAGLLMCTVFANDNMFSQHKVSDTYSDTVSSYVPQKKPENLSKSDQNFDINKASELISKYYDYKSVVEYDPNDFLSYAGFRTKDTIEKNYEIDNTSWVFWDHFQIELWKYFSFDIVISDFAKHYEITEFEGSKTVNYYGKEKADTKIEYTILEVNSLKKLDDGYTCKAKISANNGLKSEEFVKDFNFIFFNQRYQLAEIL